MTIDLNYSDEGAGQTVVLLHPVGLDLSSWDEVAERLASRFRIIRFDLAGHGRSGAAPPVMTLSDHASCVARALVRLDCGPAHVVGLSFGGMVAQTVAIEQPALCRSAVFAGCPCTFPENARESVRERGRVALRDGMAAVLESTLERWFTPSYLASGRADRVRHHLMKQDVEGWASAWNAISNLDTLKRLAAIKARSLCIAGELDKGASVDAVRLMWRSIPEAQFAIIENAPHMMQLESPQHFADLVRTFLDN